MSYVFEMRTLVRESIAVRRDGRSVTLSIPIDDGWQIHLTDRQARTLYAGLQREKLGDKDGEMLQKALAREENANREVKRLEMVVRAMRDERHADTELLNQIRGLLLAEDDDE